MQKQLWFILCGSLLLNGCGGGTMGGGEVGKPSTSVSPKTLTFGDEVTGTTSQSLTITLTNFGTAALSIASIAASANFQQTNNCGSTLAPAANCTIIVTFSPTTAGSLSGTISINDNAAGSPQTIPVSGTGIIGTPSYALTGDCFGGGPANLCATLQDTAQCPIGQTATPTTVSGCLPPRSAVIDTSTSCSFTSNGLSFRGSCVVAVSGSTGSCSAQGQQCGAPQLPPCCAGLECSPASDRAFCVLATGNISSATRSPSVRLADTLR